ncbi:MAG: 30S ribosomal protein S3 [Chloroflexi bacterium]|nr:30S ribosomal protein S3 [Chloroflexota bacterium]
MGQKTHPVGFRLGIIKDWQAKWYANKPAQYRELLQEDLQIRRSILSRLPEAGISRVELERGAQELVVTIHSARPGIVIGRGGQRVEDVRKMVEGLSHKRARLNVQEIRQPELDAQLVAASIAEQLGRRIAFRRAMHQAMGRAMQAGALGIKIICGGRLGGIEIARREKVMEGRVPLHTLRADIDFGLAEAHTAMGRVGVKVWIYKGDILPAMKELETEVEAEEMRMIEVTVGGQEEPSEESQHAAAQKNQISENA